MMMASARICRKVVVPTQVGAKIKVDLRGNTSVVTVSNKVTDWTEQASAADFAQSSDPLRPLGNATLGGLAAVIGDATDDFLEVNTPTLGSFISNNAFWVGTTFRLDVAPTDTHSGTSVWEAHGGFADGGGFFGLFFYLSAGTNKVAATFFDAATGYVTIAYSGTLTVGQTYYLEFWLSATTFGISVNAVTPDTTTTAKVVSAAGLSAAKLRVFRGNRAVSAGITIGDLICANAMLTASELSTLRKLWFYMRRTGVVVP